LKRHQILTIRTPEAVTSASGNVAEADIRKWFSQIEDYFEEKQYTDILKDPTRIFNDDETAFQLCPKIGKVLTPKGAKNIYEIDQAAAKSNITVMFTFAASGNLTPPMLIYPYKRLPASIAETVPDDWGVAVSDNGWMKAEIFWEYISNVLHPHLKRINVKFPIILFVDGHTTHLTYEVSKLCSTLEVVLVALYPNAIRILQPADVSCFRPIKSMWKKDVMEWRRNNPFCQLTKKDVAPILSNIIKGLQAETISHDFRACGLYPWNANSIDYSNSKDREVAKMLLNKEIR
jgi:hypothetical protein